MRKSLPPGRASVLRRAPREDGGAGAASDRSNQRPSVAAHRGAIEAERRAASRRGRASRGHKYCSTAADRRPGATREGTPAAAGRHAGGVEVAFGRACADGNDEGGSRAHARESVSRSGARTRPGSGKPGGAKGRGGAPASGRAPRAAKGANLETTA